MSIRMRRHDERAQRVELFLDESAEDFPAGSKGDALAVSIREERSSLSALAVARSAGTSKRRQGTAGRGGARAALRELVESVADTAKSAARERPEMKGLFDLAGKDRSDGTLIATARAFAEAAPPFVGLLVDYGLKTTLVEDLRAGAESLEQNISLQAAGASTGISITASAGETIQRLADLIERIDPIIRNKYRDNPAKVTAWERARRLESAPNSKGSGNNTSLPPDKGAQAETT